MAKFSFSTKRLQISKANQTMMAFMAITSFLVIFALVASRALISQRTYQSKVISEKQIARNQLRENIKAAKNLTAAYQQFVNQPDAKNILGGNATGRGEKDGDNAKIVLDALPSKYDYPALTSSLEKLLNDKNYKIETITGTDDELNQKLNATSPQPEVVDMPFQVVVNGSYPAVQGLIMMLERSIRPFSIQTIEFAGNDSLIRMTVTAKSYYQPEKSLNITKKVIE